MSVRPRTDIYRLARGPEPFAPPEWVLAGADGTFGNRFDDPSADAGNGPERRFRSIYCATQRRATFGETLARFRVSLSLLAALDEIEDDETTAEALTGAVDPTDRTRGLVPADWRIKRRVGQATLAGTLAFADLAMHDTMQVLRRHLAPLAQDLGLTDIDLGTLAGPQRRFTQACARHIYDLSDRSGLPRFAGIRYVSRLDAAWECWAVFADRLVHAPGSPNPPTLIAPDDPDLLAVAAAFRLTIEIISGTGSFIRP